MKLTREMIVSHNPCIDGLEWYDKNGSDDLLDTLLRVDEYRPDWARWLFVKLMDHSERLEIAIYSANLVLHIFEERFPGDKRPREAIEAAKKCLSFGLADAANVAAAATAYAAADAAADAAAANAAYAAAYAAYAAAYAAYAAAYAAYAAAYATADASAATDEKTRVLIIKEAVRILEKRKGK